MQGLKGADPVVVIGAGQSGLATAHWLADAGLPYVVLEAGQGTAGNWPSYYDSLKLFSPARYSGLPGMPFPGDPDHYPRRDAVVAYLRAYGQRFASNIMLGQRVERIVRADDALQVQTAAQVWRARAVVVASGPFNQPHRPRLAGMDIFSGPVLHSSQYRNPAQLPEGPVAVVGGGNSAVQIAYELSATRPVTLFTRQKLRFLPQRIAGRDVHFWLRSSGWDSAPFGAWWGIKPSEPIIDTGIFRAAIAEGRIRHSGMFSTLTPDGAKVGEQKVPFTSLILATGFASAPAFLSDLDGALVDGRIHQRAGKALAVPDLYYAGLSWQVSHRSATLRGIGADTRALVADIARRGAQLPERAQP